MDFKQPNNSNYYDLVRIPHGHIPAPMIKFWGWIPIPVKGTRSYNTFHCPVCGSPSFYKTGYGCHECQYDYEQEFKRYHKREQRRKNWKRLEHAILPLLVILGKVWYMPSERLTHLEQIREYGPPIQIEIDFDEETGELCALCGNPLTMKNDFDDHPLCCDKHGDYLNLCESCNHWFEYIHFVTPGNCIREAFSKTHLKMRNDPK